MDATVVSGQQGRIVIPANVLAAPGLQPGEHLHVEDEGLVLERPHRAAAQLRGLAQAVTDPSLLDELLAERQAEVASS